MELPQEIAMLAGMVNQENAKIMSMADSMGGITDPNTGAKVSDNSLGVGNPIGIQDLVLDQQVIEPPVNDELPELPTGYNQNQPHPQASVQQPQQSVSQSKQQQHTDDPIFHPNLQPEILTKLSKIEKIQEKILEILIENANVKTDESKKDTSK